MAVNCECKRCRRGWTWREKADNPRAVAMVHFEDITNLPEWTACGRQAQEVTGNTSPFWEVVTCRACRKEKDRIERQRIYRIHPKVLR